MTHVLGIIANLHPGTFNNVVNQKYTEMFNVHLIPCVDVY